MTETLREEGQFTGSQLSNSFAIKQFQVLKSVFENTTSKSIDFRRPTWPHKNKTGKLEKVN